MNAGRLLFLAWAASIWGAWYLSGELLASLKGLTSLAGYLLSPPWPGAIEVLGIAALAVFSAGVVCLAMLCAGCAILMLFGRSPQAPGGFLLAFAAGMPIVAMLTQSLGLLGIISPWFLTAMSVGMAAGGLGWIRRIRFLSWKCPLPLALIIGVSIAAVILGALGPAVAWDEVIYHLRVPRLYMMARKIHPIPEIFPSYFPFSGEMIMMLAHNLGGEQGARLTHTLVWLVCAAGTARMAGLLGGAGNGPWALALFVTIPMGQVIAARAYVDFFIVLGVIGMLLAAFEGEGGGRAWRLPLGGWLAGGIAGVQYLGWLIGPLMAFWFFWRLKRCSISKLALFLCAGVLACGLWPARNVLWMGNPAYPLLWGGMHWTAQDTVGWLRDARAFDMTPGSLFAAPWRLLRHTPLDGGISPLLLTLAALPLLGLRRRGVGGLGLLAAAMFIMLQAVSAMPRYDLPVLALLAVFVPGYLGRLKYPGKSPNWLRRLVLLGLAVGPLCGIWELHLGTKPFHVSLGKMTQRQFMKNFFAMEGYHDVVEELNRIVPRRGRAFFMGFLHSHGLERRSWYDFFYTRPSLYWWLDGAGSAERIAIHARQAGLTHVVYHPLVDAAALFHRREGKMDWTKVKLAAYREFWSWHVREHRRFGGWIIYEISRVPGYHPPPFPLPGAQEALAVPGPG